MKRTWMFVLACGLAGLALLPQAVHAQSSDPDANHVTLGAQWWDQTTPEAQYQTYRDLPRGGFLDSFLLHGNRDRNFFQLSGSRILQNDAKGQLFLANGAKWRFDGSLTLIPHLYSLIARSLYSQPSPGVLTLPDSLQARNQGRSDTTSVNSLMRSLLPLSPHDSLAFRTSVIGARERVRPAMGWMVEATGGERIRQGARPYGATFGFSNPIEVPLPVDDRMLDGDLRADYGRKGLSFRAEGGVSAYRNKIPSLTWDNPKQLVDTPTTPGRAQMALAPSSTQLRGDVALGLSLTPVTTFSVQAGLAQNKQNAAFLPMTIDTALIRAKGDTLNLPARSLDGKANILTLNGQLTSRAVANIAATVRARYRKYDNKTPGLTFSGEAPLTAGFTYGGDEGVENEPASYKNTVLGADLDYNLFPGMSVGGTYELRLRERQHREMDKDKENFFGARTRIRLMEGLSFDAKYSHGKREFDAPFDSTEFDTTEGNNPLGFIRFDVANRTQNQLSGGLAWSPQELVDLFVGYTATLNKYPDTAFGLQNQAQRMVTAHATVHPLATLDLTGGYGFGHITTDQQSSKWSAAARSRPDVSSYNWALNTNDKDHFAYVSADWTPVERVGVNVGYQYEKGLVTYTGWKFNVAPTAVAGTGTVVPWPDTDLRHATVNFEIHYNILASTQLGWFYGYERARYQDYTLTGVQTFEGGPGPAAAQQNIYLGNRLLNYDANRVAAFVTRKF